MMNGILADFIGQRTSEGKEVELLRTLAGNQAFLKWMGIDVLEAGPGWVRERLAIRPEFLQPQVVHGGVIYSLADTVAAHAVLTLIYPREWITTIEQKINFLRPVTSGVLTGVGRVAQLGNRIVYCEAEILNEAGDLMAKSTATLMRLTPR